MGNRRDKKEMYDSQNENNKQERHLPISVAQNHSAAYTRKNPKRSISLGGIVTLIVDWGKESLEQLPPTAHKKYAA